MMEIFVNDVPHALPQTPQTWGELLANLDDHAADAGLLLTTARFDGVEEPSFRDPEVTARRLASVNRVDVETAAPAAFLRECLIESIEPMKQAAHMATELSAIFRGHDLASGHEGLTALAVELRGLASLVAMLGGPLRIDLSAISTDGTTAAQQMEILSAAVDSVVAAQESEDWLTVADVLEYDLEPSIRQWVKLLGVLAGALSASAARS
jgi:hypothetical protein